MVNQTSNGNQKTRADDWPQWKQDFYREGSAACRNYSQLTMQVRTLSQHILVGYVVGLALFVAYSTAPRAAPPDSVQQASKEKQPNSEEKAHEKSEAPGRESDDSPFPPYFPWVVLTAGIALVLFSIALLFVNWHYQSAFEAIRDRLASLEFGSPEEYGPWCAHQYERERWRDSFAWGVPLGIPCVVGLGGALFVAWNPATANAANAAWAAMVISLMFVVLAYWICRRRIDPQTPKPKPPPESNAGKGKETH